VNSTYWEQNEVHFPAVASCPLQDNFWLNIFSDGDPSFWVCSGVALSWWLRLQKNHLVTWEWGITRKHSKRGNDESMAPGGQQSPSDMELQDM